MFLYLSFMKYLVVFSHVWSFHKWSIEEKIWGWFFDQFRFLFGFMIGCLSGEPDKNKMYDLFNTTIKNLWMTHNVSIVGGS